MHYFYITGIGKRSLKEETPLSPEADISITKLDDNIVPEQFNLENYPSPFEAHRLKRQVPNTYLLIVLDASGSIGSSYFQSMRDVAGKLAKYSCNTKVAVMSYSNYIYGQYCFNCPQINLNARKQIQNTINSIPFSNKATASGDAIACACEHVLKDNSKCEFKKDSTGIVSVVFITDGRSNRGRGVCAAATKCWRAASTLVDTLQVIPIHITNAYRISEINCIRGDYGTDISLQSFEDLKKLVNDLETETNKGNSC